MFWDLFLEMLLETVLVKWSSRLFGRVYNNDMRWCSRRGFGSFKVQGWLGVRVSWFSFSLEVFIFFSFVSFCCWGRLRYVGLFQLETFFFVLSQFFVLNFLFIGQFFRSVGQVFFRFWRVFQLLKLVFFLLSFVFLDGVVFFFILFVF